MKDSETSATSGGISVRALCKTDCNRILDSNYSNQSRLVSQHGAYLDLYLNDTSRAIVVQAGSIPNFRKRG